MAIDGFRLALIGTGGIAKRHVTAMADLKSKGLGSFAVTAVCDVNEGSAQAAADDLEERFGLRPAVYADHQELLSKEEIDGADLCLPHSVHHAIGVDCMDSGVHVLCEKPLGITMRACQEMVDAAERTGCVLSVAVPMRRTLGQRTAHWVLNESKLIGEPLTFFHHAAGPLRSVPTDDAMPPRRIWRRNRLISGGRHVLDSGFHYCDSIRYLLGDVEKVYAEAREFASGAARSLQEGVEDAVYVTLTFENGVVGLWSFGLILPGEMSGTMMLYGSKGSLRDMAENPWRVFHLFGEDNGQLTKADGTKIPYEEVERMYLESLSEEEKEYIFPGGIRDGFAHEIWEFIEVVHGNREKPEVDGWEGLRSQALSEAIYESAYAGEVVRIEDVIAGRRRSYQAPIDEHWGL